MREPDKIPETGIYKIENMETGDFYIGSSSKLKERLRKHKRYLRKGIHGNEFLQRSFDKYGKDAFQFAIIESEFSEIETLRDREQFFIDKLEPTYNLIRDVSRRRKTSEEIQRITEGTRKALKKGKGRAKLTVSDVLEIKKLLKETDIPQPKIAEEFNISRNRISGINCGRNWSYITGIEYPSRIREDEGKGEKNNGSLLTKKEVEKIVDLLKDSNLAFSTIGEKFGVNEVAIRGIQEGRTWNHITGIQKHDRIRDTWGEIRTCNGKKVNSKLTESEVEKIKELLKNSDLSYREIAKQFDISTSSVGNIKRGVTWSYVEVEGK